MAARSHRVVVFQDASGDWRWRIVAGNHRIVGAAEEGFRRKGYAVRKARLAAVGYPDAVLVVEEKL